MRTLKLIYLLALGLVVMQSSCKEDEPPTLGEPPSDADAQFTYKASATSDNIIEFTAANPSLTAKWDFGNGTTGEGAEVTAIYPNKGTYTVKLTVFNQGGSNSSTQDIVIAEDDPTLLNSQLFTWLTGGVNGGGSKTWVIDSTRDGHFGVGPNPSKDGKDTSDHWTAKAMDKSATGFYDDMFTFHLNGFKFDQVTNGHAYANRLQKDNFSDAEEVKGDWKVAHPNQMGESWLITEGEDTTLTISGDAFIGYYAGKRTYKIVRISENELYLRTEDDADPTLAWYMRLVPDDYPIKEKEEGDKYSLPLDFESGQVTFEAFGGSTDTVIANPVPGGINTSGNVLETTKGFETWAGIYVDLENTLDFSGSDSTISVKIYAPTTGVMRVKLENIASSGGEFIEKDVDITKANEWIEVSVGFSTAPTGKFDRLVLFPSWNVANGGTFYLDDISQK